MPRIRSKIGPKNKTNPKRSAREQMLRKIPLFQNIKATIGSNAHIVSVALNPAVRRNTENLLLLRPHFESRLELNARIDGVGRIVPRGEYQIVGIVDYLLPNQKKPAQVVLAVKPQVLPEKRLAR